MLSRSPTNNCSYEVTFVTPDACKINQVVQANNVNENNCVFEGAEGVELDFNLLPKSVSYHAACFLRSYIHGSCMHRS